MKKKANAKNSAQLNIFDQQKSGSENVKEAKVINLAVYQANNESEIRSKIISRYTD